MTPALAPGMLRAELAPMGRSIGAYDARIVAQARRRRLVVATANGRAFERVDGLRIENWRT